ncbi:MAG: hypothetical protein ACFFHV_06355, partial [Promethearchaeota archaeon]
MSVPIYKVIFKGIKEKDETKLHLIFKGFKSDKRINIPSHLILELKEISKSNQNVISYQNISEVIKVGKESSLLTYNYYFVILYKSKDGKRKGFLIGNEKKSGDILMGTWPFTEEFLSEKFFSTFSKLVE